MAIAYKQTPVGLRGKLGCSLSEASFIHNQLENLYNKYFDVCVYNRNHLFENISISRGCEFDELFNVKIIGEFDE